MIDLSALDEPFSPQELPVLTVEYDGREAIMLLDKMPRPGYGWIKYEDGSDEIEVALSQCTIMKLTDVGAVS